MQLLHCLQHEILQQQKIIEKMYRKLYIEVQNTRLQSKITYIEEARTQSTPTPLVQYFYHKKKHKHIVP